METVNIHEAKTQLSKLIERVLAGEEIVIAKAGKPVAKLVAAAAAKKPRRPGLLKGKIKFDESFFEPLPDEELKRWEGR
jgi:prevent-host-death family protein